eukprot:CAMPEP_0117445636 /NCGR_PEP_ID=MMETSP0759-20121206/5905_1 /TAXON_ID=63605 /ORGANISM="Percolomonas cosmopolitus, Strain WS" /LENGTH=538 /DNA_ID=CAMNT_0005237833 /DNA_START=242 /DNA_END=1858 /DNA_ORIENTATION=-
MPPGDLHHESAASIASRTANPSGNYPNDGAMKSMPVANGTSGAALHSNPSYIAQAPIPEASLHNTSPSTPNNIIITNADESQFMSQSPTIDSALGEQITEYSFYGFKIKSKPSHRSYPYLPYLYFTYLISHVLIFYILAGVVQESIFNHFNGFKFGWFMTLWQFGAYAIFSCGQIMREGRIEARRRMRDSDLLHFTGKSMRERNSSIMHKNIILNQDDDTILGAGMMSQQQSNDTSGDQQSHNASSYEGLNSPLSHANTTDSNAFFLTPTSFDWRTFLSTKKASAWKILFLYMILASLSVLGMGFGNQALNYLNYPTKILFKSCKLLSVMLVGLVLLKKQYSRMDYLASISLIAGLFTLYTANRAVNIEFNLTGVLFMCMALLADSVTSNFQEKLLQDYDQSPLNLIFYVHGLGFFHLFVVCLFTQQLKDGFAFCLKHPSLILFLLLYSLFAFVGAQYLHSLTKRSNILITLTVTSVRKVLSILISFMIFPKPIHYGHFAAMILVFVGVALRVLNKTPKKSNGGGAGTLLPHASKKAS